VRSASLRFTPRRFAPLRSAPRKSASMRSAPRKSASMRSASLRFALMSFAPMKFARLRSALLRLARLRFVSMSSASMRSGFKSKFFFRHLCQTSTPCFSTFRCYGLVMETPLVAISKSELSFCRTSPLNSSILIWLRHFRNSLF